MDAPVGTFPVQSHQPGVIIIYHKVTWGASGAVTSQTGSGNGLVSFADTATGRHTVTFAEKYPALLWAGMLPDSQGTATGAQIEIYTAYDADTGIVVLSNVVGTSETDATSGNVCWYRFDVQVTSAGLDL